MVLLQFLHIFDLSLRQVQYFSSQKVLAYGLCNVFLLTTFPQSVVNEVCSRSEKRLEIKLWMVCSFHAKVLHFKVTVELLTCVDSVLTCCSVQYVSYTQS